MKLTRIEGPAVTLECCVCSVVGIGGSLPYESASSGEERKPDEWYTEPAAHDENDEMLFNAYCGACAAKLSQQDEARSVNQFFSDTSGNEILPSILPDEQ
jgi:hypothetical protein